MGALGSNFVPLNLGLIEGGEFARALDKHMQLAQSELVAYVEHHGELAGKAKASLTIKINFQCESTHDHLYTIEPKIELKLPSRPVRITSAFAQADKRTGQLSMFVNDLGSAEADPTQSRLGYPAPNTAETAD